MGKSSQNNDVHTIIASRHGAVILRWWWRIGAGSSMQPVSLAPASWDHRQAEDRDELPPEPNQC
jgi:hypothetical protein